ncbi:phospholipase D family protein [Acinetobacter larvae]|uniref:phospholipase D n=1 Tax=Acinetobacter larvae TaxID=1789224 RepID=A0A1B2LX15_9GAMM|nr:phospholipase D family protein [Acinetobacter larvae]AOA57476.1 phospholipase [Acinetobacter larvae]
MRIFRKVHQKLNWSKKRYVGLIVTLFGVAYVASAIYQTVKPLAEGLNYASPLQRAELTFLADQTYLDRHGQQQSNQQIFDQILTLVKQAKTTIVLDMFLFNQQVGGSTLQHRALSQQLTDALMQKRIQQPNVQIVFITDPINTVYGGVASEQFRQLRQAGVDVIETDLRPLRASNPMWSGLWYLCCKDLGNNQQAGWLKNPFGTEKITIRSYLNLLNFKANHRKVIAVDTDEGWQAVVTSMNPHDGSSRHSNVGVLIKGKVAVDVLNTEQAVAALSAGSSPLLVTGADSFADHLPKAQVLTEGAIYQAVLHLLDSAKAGERIDLMMFYLSERKIIEKLMAAQARGVKVRIILDPNKDAFGRQKNGIPNRQVAAELDNAGIDIRWCDTHGEQCHSKMIMKYNNKETELILGSANFTARNLKNYNLETNIRALGASENQVFRDAREYFKRAWFNQDGEQYTVDYTVYQDDSSFKYALYRLMEWSGISTF